LELLKASKLFSKIKEEELKQIIPLFEKVDYVNGEWIFIEGDTSEWLYILKKGKVKTIKHTQCGKDIILDIKSACEIFGCTALMDNTFYAESAQAKGDVSVIRICRRNLIKILYEYPLQKFRIFSHLNDRLADAYTMLQLFSTEKVERRIELLLLKHSEKASTESLSYRMVDCPLTRQEIAEMAGTTVETCTRFMSKFQKKGIVKFSKKRILVKA
jgi:CRP/FNR family transcriptional regulator